MLLNDYVVKKFRRWRSKWYRNSYVTFKCLLAYDDVQTQRVPNIVIFAADTNYAQLFDCFQRLLVMTEQLNNIHIEIRYVLSFINPKKNRNQSDSFSCVYTINFPIFLWHFYNGLIEMSKFLMMQTISYLLRAFHAASPFKMNILNAYAA